MRNLVSLVLAVVMVVAVPTVGFGQAMPSAYQPYRAVPIPVAAITVLNVWSAFTNGNTSQAVTVSPAAGHALVVAYATAQTTQPTISDNLTSSYTTVPAFLAVGLGTGFFFLGSCGSGLTTVTIGTAGSTPIEVFVFEVSGVSTYTGGDTNNAFTASTTTPSSGSFTNSTANSIIFCIGTGTTSSNSTTFGTFTSGYALFGGGPGSATDPNGVARLATAVPDAIVSSIGTQSLTMTATSSGNWALVIAAFH